MFIFLISHKNLAGLNLNMEDRFKAITVKLANTSWMLTTIYQALYWPLYRWWIYHRTVLRGRCSCSWHVRKLNHREVIAQGHITRASGLSVESVFSQYAAWPLQIKEGISVVSVRGRVSQDMKTKPLRKRLTLKLRLSFHWKKP